MKPELVKRVKELSQEEGLFDYEIAEVLNKHRVTITRCREKHRIPRPNLENRKDKQQVCRKCGKVEYIRRKQGIKGYCTECKKEANEARKQYKREYMKSYQKKKKDPTILQK